MLTTILAWFASGGPESIQNGTFSEVFFQEYESISIHWFLLAKFGWFGGLIYSILTDGGLKLPVVDLERRSAHSAGWERESDN